MNDKELLLAKLKEEKFYLEAKYLGAKEAYKHLAAELTREELYKKNIYKGSKIKIPYRNHDGIGIFSEVRIGYREEPVVIWHSILKSGKTSKILSEEDRLDVIKTITRVE